MKRFWGWQWLFLLGVALGVALLLSELVESLAVGWAWLMSVTAVSFVTYGYDKGIAGSKRRRIAESSLLLLALVGGTIGAGVAIYLFRHKTQKRPFLNRFWGIVAVQGVIFLLFTFFY